MHCNELKLYDEFYVKEYRYLRGFCKSIDPREDYESLLHDCYIKCRDRIEINGYQGTDYMNFVRVTIMNTFKSEYRKKKKRMSVDVLDNNYYSHIEEMLLLAQTQSEQDQETYHENQCLVTYIYDFIDKYYDPKSVMIFKTYYLLKRKHLNYRQLSEATGYSMTAVSNTIKCIKKDLKENLQNYILYGERVILI